MPNKSKKWRPLKSMKPITSIKVAREITKQFHQKKATKRDIHETLGIHTTHTYQPIPIPTHPLAYQAASAFATTINTRGKKFVCRHVTKLNLRPSKGEPALKTLEIGAINTQLLSIPWLDVDAIDLRSRHARIREVDFFSFYKETPPLSYSILTSFMVLNCVPTAAARGDMLLQMHALLEPNGLLFLSLPRQCIKSVKLSMLKKIFKAVGFVPMEEEFSERITFILFRKVKDADVKKLKGFKLKDRKDQGESKEFSITFTGVGD